MVSHNCSADISPTYYPIFLPVLTISSLRLVKPSSRLYVSQCVSIASVLSNNGDSRYMFYYIVVFHTRLTSPKHILTYMCNGQSPSLATIFGDPRDKRDRKIRARLISYPLYRCTSKDLCVFLYSSRAASSYKYSSLPFGGFTLYKGGIAL